MKWFRKVAKFFKRKKVLPNQYVRAFDSAFTQEDLALQDVRNRHESRSRGIVVIDEEMSVLRKDGYLMRTLGAWRETDDNNLPVLPADTSTEDLLENIDKVAKGR